MPTERSCGGCTACCKTHAVLELKKPRGSTCFHSQNGSGCLIYSARPRSCQAFQCAWLLGLGLPEYRPDLVKVVVEYRQMPEVGLVPFLFELESGAIESEFVRRQTRANLALGNSIVHIPISGTPKLFLGPGRQIGKLRFTFDGLMVNILPFEPNRF